MNSYKKTAKWLASIFMCLLIVPLFIVNTKSVCTKTGIFVTEIGIGYPLGLLRPVVPFYRKDQITEIARIGGHSEHDRNSEKVPFITASLLNHLLLPLSPRVGYFADRLQKVFNKNSSFIKGMECIFEYDPVFYVTLEEFVLSPDSGFECPDERFKVVFLVEMMHHSEPPYKLHYFNELRNKFGFPDVDSIPEEFIK